MRISSKGRYALRLMIDLATYHTGEPISVRDIARREGISEKYLEQIISVLNRAGFVRSVRGASGGYLLTRDPSSYTAGDILRLTEGELAPVDGPGDDAAAEGASRLVYERLHQAVNETVDSITLADLVDAQSVMADSYSI